MLPVQRDLMKPVLQALVDLGGEAKPAAVYERVTAMFPDLRPADLTEQLLSGGSRWTNRIQWTRQDLLTRGWLSNQQQGVWAITEAGRAYLAMNGGAPEPVVEDLEQLVDAYRDRFRGRVLTWLHDQSPAAFEAVAAELLHAYGFVHTEVTGRTGDGGVDGHGQLRIGLATLRAAFQCKRWRENVGGPQVDAFRGAIQGRYEQGVFFTTSGFTKAAQAKSLQAGAVPIVLLDGPAIVDLMVAHEVHIRRAPVYRYELLSE